MKMIIILSMMLGGCALLDRKEPRSVIAYCLRTGSPNVKVTCKEYIVRCARFTPEKQDFCVLEWRF